MTRHDWGRGELLGPESRRDSLPPPTAFFQSNLSLFLLYKSALFSSFFLVGPVACGLFSAEFPFFSSSRAPPSSSSSSSFVVVLSFTDILPFALEERAMRRLRYSRWPQNSTRTKKTNTYSTTGIRQRRINYDEGDEESREMNNARGRGKIPGREDYGLLL